MVACLDCGVSVHADCVGEKDTATPASELDYEETATQQPSKDVEEELDRGEGEVASQSRPDIIGLLLSRMKIDIEDVLQILSTNKKQHGVVVTEEGTPHWTVTEIKG